MQELRPGLWSWTGAEGRSYAYDSGGCLVLFDPSSPPSLLDGLIEAQEIGVLLTADGQRRSADECVDRYGAHVFTREQAPPGDVERFATGAEGFAYWIPRHHALVLGTLEVEEARRTALLELPVEHVLPTTGDPVLENGGGHLRAALRA